MEYTLAGAALAVGVGKTTVFRSIKSGRLSARRLEDGSYRIDASELARAFPPVPQQQREASPWKDKEQLGTALEGGGTELAVLRVRLEMAEMRSKMLEDQLAREQELADRVRETVGDLRARLDRAEERVLALSAPTIQPPLSTPEVAQEKRTEVSMAAEAPKASKGFLARLLGL